MIYEKIPGRIKADLEDDSEPYLPQELIELEREKINKNYPSNKNRLIRELVSQYQYLIYFTAKLKSEIIELNKFTKIRQPEDEYFLEENSKTSLFNKYFWVDK